MTTTKASSSAASLWLIVAGLFFLSGCSQSSVRSDNGDGSDVLMNGLLRFGESR